MLQLQLQDKNEQLYTRLEDMQTRYSELMNSKTQLSSKLISSEEEKLQVRHRQKNKAVTKLAFYAAHPPPHPLTFSNGLS